MCLCAPRSRGSESRECIFGNYSGVSPRPHPHPTLVCVCALVGAECVHTQVRTNVCRINDERRSLAQNDVTDNDDDDGETKIHLCVVCVMTGRLFGRTVLLPQHRVTTNARHINQIYVCQTIRSIARVSHTRHTTDSKLRLHRNLCPFRATSSAGIVESTRASSNFASSVHVWTSFARWRTATTT